MSNEISKMTVEFHFDNGTLTIAELPVSELYSLTPKEFYGTRVIEATDVHGVRAFVSADKLTVVKIREHDYEETSQYVTVPRSQLNRWVESDNILDCLRSYGVDNWEGYDEAMSEYEKSKGTNDTDE